MSMDYTKYQELWAFLTENLPNYYRRNDVLRSDILFRCCCDEKVDETDMIWITTDAINIAIINQTNSVH